MKNYLTRQQNANKGENLIFKILKVEIHRDQSDRICARHVWKAKYTSENILKKG
jgi:hypothetical protein